LIFSIRREIQIFMLPTIFISHGSPMIALENSPAQTFLTQLGNSLPRPKAILSISAHWATLHPTVSLAALPETIYDFGGFPQALYEMKYSALGAPELSLRIQKLLSAANIECEAVPNRGFDHGTWIPLRLMYPEADIPVAQLSVQPDNDANSHYAIGQVLQSLREEGVLILASGTAVHNLQAIRPGAETPAWAVKFEQWLTDEVASGEAANLLQYAQLPEAKMAHPTPEHFLPIFVALGAAANASGQFRGETLHRSWELGSLGMASYSFA
jgi:4,5-DOPA dioxygenase extradiol